MGPKKTAVFDKKTAVLVVAERGLEPPTLSLIHISFETVGKLDCYMNYLGCMAVYNA